jgi:CBS domain-containing protein
MQSHVGDVMTSPVVSTGATATYRQLARLLTAHRISGVPVVDGLGRVIGVVSEADLLGRLDRGRRGRRSGRAGKRGLSAGELMSAPPVTAMPSTPLAVAARRMRAADVKRLPVVDDLGMLVGIVSRTDLLRVFLRDDDEIAADVNDGLRRVFVLDARSIVVAVHEGVVTLRGELPSAEIIELLTAWVADLDGVVGVHSLLRTPAAANHAR